MISIRTLGTWLGTAALTVGLATAAAAQAEGEGGGDPIEELDDISMSALGELANMITGNATIQLADAGYKCDISTPVLLPKGAVFHTPNAQIRALFSSGLGPMSIRISLTE